jgi:hypothetical protein
MFSKYSRTPGNARKATYALAQLVAHQLASVISGDPSALAMIGRHAGIDDATLAEGLHSLSEDAARQALRAPRGIRDRLTETGARFLAASLRLKSAAEKERKHA